MGTPPRPRGRKGLPDEWVENVIKQQLLFDDEWGDVFAATKKAQKARAPIERALLDFLYGASVRGFKD